MWSKRDQLYTGFHIMANSATILTMQVWKPKTHQIGEAGSEDYSPAYCLLLLHSLSVQSLPVPLSHVCSVCGVS